jgi:hypothetical protein
MPSMSYPSLNRFYEQAGTTPENATICQHHAAYLAAFEQDLPLGMAHVRKLADSIKQGEPQSEITLDPNSIAGKQLARLIGADVARSVLQQHFGVRFTFFNCCGVVADDPKTSEASEEELLIKQARLQQAEFVDC